MGRGREAGTHVVGDPEPARIERDVPIDRHAPARAARDDCVRPRLGNVRDSKDVVDDGRVRRRAQRTALTVEAVKVDVGTAQLEICLFRRAITASGRERVLDGEEREVG